MPECTGLSIGKNTRLHRISLGANSDLRIRAFTRLPIFSRSRFFRHAPEEPVPTQLTHWSA